MSEPDSSKKELCIKQRRGDGTVVFAYFSDYSSLYDILGYDKNDDDKKYSFLADIMSIDNMKGKHESYCLHKPHGEIRYIAPHFGFKFIDCPRHPGVGCEIMVKI